MLDPFIEQLKRLCNEDRVGAKWVLVPNQSLRWTLGERLVLEGCNWVNLRFVTPLQLATEVAAPELVAQGIDPCPETLGPSLLQNLLMRLPEEGGYFRGLGEQPGVAEALWRSLGEFRLAGLTSQDLERLPDGPKRQELTQLFRSYEDYLSEHNLADRAMLLATPVQLAAEDSVLVYPYHCWSPLELQLLSGLEGRSVPPETALDAEGVGWWPRRSAGSTPAKRRFFAAVRRRDEVEEVVARIARERWALDQVELACAAEDYGLVADRLAVHNIDCSFEAGLPVLATRPGRLLDGLLEWLEHEVSAFHLRELLEAHLLQASIDNFRAVRLLESAQVRWGRDTYSPQLQSLAELTRKRLPQDARAAQQLQELEQLQTWVERLLARFPSGDVVPAVWLCGLAETLRQDFRVQRTEDAQARQAVLGALAELQQLPQDPWPRRRFLALLRQRLKSQRALASRPRPGKVHVCRVESLGLSGRPHGFWLGVEEGRMLTQHPQDCVFSDGERALLHPGLVTSLQRTSRQLSHWRERLATFPGTLTLSYAERDASGEQEQVASWLFLDLVREQCPEVDSYAKLEAWLGPAVHAPWRRCSEMLAQQQRALQASVARASSRFTDYDGQVPAAAGLWDPRVTGKPISVSRLKALATCPFQVFLENGLGLERPPAPLPESDSWLDAATRGTVLHECYAGYHRMLRAQGWRPDRERDLQGLWDLLDEQLQLVRQVLPAPSPGLEGAEREALQHELEHFLKLEIDSPRRPLAFEVPFGMGPDDQEPLSHDEPVWLDFGNQRLPVRGRIDRIDLLDEGYAVVDYKTGRQLYTSQREPIFDRGRLLQHSVYALVVEQLVQAPGQLRQSSYYFPTTAAARPWAHFDYPDRDALGRVLELVLEPLQSGAFVHSHDRDKDCRFCDYQPACEAHLDSDVRKKLDDPALQARRRLLEER